MMIEVKPTGDNRVAISSPYNADFVSGAKRLGGKWSSPYWIFPAEVLTDVRRLLVEVYGEDDRAQAKRVRLRVLVEALIDEGGQGDVVVGGRQLARAYGRDSGAKLGEDIVVLKGGFSSGGSRKNWCITFKVGTVVDILRLPEPKALALVAKFPNHCTIVADDGSTIEEAGTDSNVVQLRGSGEGAA